MSPDNKPSVAFDDILWGVDGIAREAHVSRRRAQYLIEIGKIGVTRLAPKTIITTRTRLKQDFAALISESAEKSV